MTPYYQRFLSAFFQAARTPSSRSLNDLGHRLPGGYHLNRLLLRCFDALRIQFLFGGNCTG
ncbi:protein of unknown function [Pseudomonas marincola]|uniref:Uncharacterized protein n=1 Tax=Pseudomonas marincola TaxID=437900 RepID=A0A8S2BPG1_9PSED|nr:protein of unknown function [Pseudomonas marincola]